MKLNTQDNLVIEDAAKCYKSDFVALYTGLGFDLKEVSDAWHNIRTTTKGRMIMDKFKTSNGKAARFYNIEEEIKERKQTLNKTNMKSRSAQMTVKKEVEVNVVEEEFLPEDEIDATQLKVSMAPNEENIDVANKTNSKVKSKTKGDNKEAKAKSLIDSGVNKAKELSGKGGFSLPYAYNMLKKYGRA